MKRNVTSVAEVRNIDIILIRKIERRDSLTGVGVDVKITLRRVLPSLKDDINNG